MLALLETNATFQLFSPLLIGSALVLFVFVLGRMVAARKISRALSVDDDGPPLVREPDAPIAAFRPRIRPTSDVERTHEFVRVGSGEYMDAVTQQFDRVYLDASDLFEP